MAIEIVLEKHIKNATVYRDVDVEQRRQYYLLTSLAVLFGLGLLFYGWQQYRWLQSGYEIERLQKQKDELLEDQKRLILERDFQARDEKIDWIARNELGMVIAAPGQIVTLAPPDQADAPLSAANLNTHTVPGVRKTDEQCSERDSDLLTSGGSPAERCQEAR